MKRSSLLFILICLLSLAWAQNAPVANNDIYTVNKNSTTLLPIFSNDFDVNGDPLTLAIVISTLHGTVTVNTSTITYVPNLNYFGTDSFLYSICDTTLLCDTAKVIINITNINNAPVAVNDSYTSSENTPVTLPVISNDQDVDGDALTVTVFAPSANGTTTVINGSQVIYTPNLNFYGSDSFTYIICDAEPKCDTAKVYITVLGFNMPPTVSVSEVTFGDTLTTATINLGATDTDNDSIYIQEIIDLDTSNKLGTLTIDGINLAFERAPFACGSKTFEYIICAGLCDTNQLTITVTCPEEIFLTQGFSPDGDGLNDLLVFTGLEYFSPAEFKVFNRYGNLVYESTDYKNDWNGTLENGKAIPDGTYFYILKLVDGRKFNNYLVINR